MYLNHEPWFQAPYLRCLRLLCLRSRRKGEDVSLSAKRKRKVFKLSSRSQPLEINLRQHHLSLTPRRSSPSQNCCCKNLVLLFVYLIRCNNKNCQYSRYVREFNIKKILWNVTYQLKCLHEFGRQVTHRWSRPWGVTGLLSALLTTFPLHGRGCCFAASWWRSLGRAGVGRGRRARTWKNQQISLLTSWSRP